MSRDERVIVRLPGTIHEAIRDEVGVWAARGLETFLFLVVTRVETPRGRLYAGRSVVLLDDGEVVRQGIATYPTEAFCRRFYGALRTAGGFQTPARLVALHSHPFGTGPVRFSGTDLGSFERDRCVFREVFGEVEFLGLVVNSDASAFDGLVVEPERMVPVASVQVVGRTFRCLAGPRGEGKA